MRVRQCFVPPPFVLPRSGTARETSFSAYTKVLLERLILRVDVLLCCPLFVEIFFQNRRHSFRPSQTLPNILSFSTSRHKVAHPHKKRAAPTHPLVSPSCEQGLETHSAYPTASATQPASRTQLNSDSCRAPTPPYPTPQDVKTMGSWTRALRKQEGDNLAVHVDGFYGGSPSSSLAAMKTAEGFDRVVLFAGGSGVTSFTALIQVTAARFDGGEWSGWKPYGSRRVSRLLCFVR